MLQPLIVIAGSAGQKRYDPPIADPVAAREAARQIGAELAKADYRLIVYSALPQFIETDVVTGYVAGCAPDRQRVIQVRFPLGDKAAVFAEAKEHADLFDYQADANTDWEASFFRSLRDADGMLLLGGVYSGMIAGHLALGYRIPTVAVASFGGASQKIWQAMIPGQDLVTQNEKNAMAPALWGPGSAAACIKVLQQQVARRREELKTEQRRQQMRSRSARVQAILAGLLFLLAVATIPIGLVALPPDSFSLLLLLYLAGPLAGASGATIRALWAAEADGVTLRTTVLGLAAGGVAAVLFLLAQIVSGGGPTGEAHPQPLAVPFAVMIGFIAGFTFDRVYRKLAETDVTRIDALRAGETPKASQGNL
jgi:hypothetical protein